MPRRMYLVDTSIISLHQRGHPRVSQRIAATASDLLSTSIVTVEEQLRGRLAVVARHFNDPRRLTLAYADLEQTFLYFRTWPVLSFTEVDLQTFLGLRQQGLRISTRDLRIAASALNRRLVVVTNNVSDFGQVPGLSLEDWAV
jgi:tRNA(fMet)-specific endonuclease VapC